MTRQHSAPSSHHDTTQHQGKHHSTQQPRTAPHATKPRTNQHSSAGYRTPPTETAQAMPTGDSQRQNQQHNTTAQQTTRHLHTSTALHRKTLLTTQNSPHQTAAPHNKTRDTAQHPEQPLRGYSTSAQRTHHTKGRNPKEEKETPPSRAKANGTKEREPANSGGTKKKEEDGGRAARKRRGPGHPRLERTERQRQGGREKKERGRGGQPQNAEAQGTKGRKQQTGGDMGVRKKNNKGTRSPEGGERKPNGNRNGEAHQNAPRRPARPTRPGRPDGREQAHTHTHARTLEWRPPTKKGRYAKGFS